MDGDADSLRGVYVPGVLASPIVSQPNGDWTHVSSQENAVTEFLLAELYGSRGLLAHNTLAGRYFSRLDVGEELFLIYGDGRTESYVVTEKLRYQAMDPDNTQGRFRDLERRSLLTAEELFWKVYAQPGQVILQTCIQAGDDPSWGRLFIIAEPLQQ
jgi:hypothetical protein